MNLRTIFFSMLYLIAMPCYADIGGIGSPVQPSNSAPEDATKIDAAKTDVDSAERQPLLVINFNLQHVYYDRVLRQAVEATEKAKPGASYDVVSIVPAGGTREQSERITNNAADNVNAVVQQMQAIGVQAGQIRVTTQSSSTMTAQEVDIFAN